VTSNSLLNIAVPVNLAINSLPDKIFSWLLVSFLTFPRQLLNSLTFLGFWDKWSFC